MKRMVLWGAFIVIIAGCSKKDTSIQIINNCNPIQSNTEFLDGTLWEIVVFKYFDGIIVSQSFIGNIKYGDTSNIIVSKVRTDNVKISFKMLPNESSLYKIPDNARKYTFDYAIKDGVKNVIIIDSTTRLNDRVNTLKRLIDLLSAPH
ncbi:MAG: hypothetical protein RR356_05730 [Bacteroidales bacterium]